MVELRDRFGLALEALLTLGALGEMLGEDFDGDDAIQPRVFGFVDFAHTTSANESEDFVRAEPRAGVNCHRGGTVAASTASNQL